ncbi:EscU/YscU/HrcU family type III secretion system export apparatus switch protein [Escherichia coli]|nr:EscU/YscU/HrcU family type III secretion system export apparatus switch protein [Escherichia coli]
MRRLQRQLAMGQIRKVVPKASVVITNLTHYAVALQSDSSRAAALFVVAKGTDEIALYIRRVAAENQVEVISRVPGTGALGLLHHPGEPANSVSALPGHRPRSDLRPANETLARGCIAAPGPEQTYFHSQRGA